jgi:hypothetical protein
MTTPLTETPLARERVKPTREQALAIAEQRKAARRRRTRLIRHAVVAASIAAFVGPFGVIYTQLAAGRDPALSTKQTVTTVASTSTSSTSAIASASARRATASASARRATASQRAAARRAAAAKVAAAASAATATQTTTPATPAPAPVTTAQS